MKESDPVDLDNQGSAMSGLLLALGATVLGLAVVSSALSSTADGVERTKVHFSDFLPTPTTASSFDLNSGQPSPKGVPESSGLKCLNPMLPDGGINVGELAQLNGVVVRCVSVPGGNTYLTSN